MNVPNWVIFMVAMVVGMTIGFWALNRMFGWMGRSRPKYQGGPAVRGVLSALQEIVEPEVRDVKEEQRQRAAEIDANTPSEK
jgi:hypothetical protein